MQNTITESIKNPSVIKCWLVVITASLLFFYSFLLLNMLNTIDSELMSFFSISAHQLGVLSSMFFCGNFIFLFPAGLILDRLSTRRIILIAMALCVVSMFAFPLTNNLVYAGISRFVSGIGSAFAFLSCIRLASRWFPPKKMALVSGCIVTMAMLGGMVAQTPFELLVEWCGWQYAMMICGGLGILFMLLMGFLLEDWPQGDSAAKDAQVDISNIGFWQSIRMVILNKNNWLGGVYTSLMNLPVFVLGALWGSIFLIQVDHLTRTEASTVIMMIFLGTMIGSPLIGWISDRLERRILPMIVGAIISVCIMLAIIYVIHLSFIVLLVLFFLLGLITSTQVLSYPAVAELNSTLVTSSAISIVSLLIMAGGFVFQPLFGSLMDLNWNHLMVNKIAVYSLTDFQLAMWIMPVGFLVALIAAIFIRETYCRRQA